MIKIKPRTPISPRSSPRNTSKALVDIPSFPKESSSISPRQPWLRSDSPDSFSLYLMKFLIVHLCPVQLRRIRSMPAMPLFSTSRQRPVPLFRMTPFCRERRWGKDGKMKT